MKSLSKIAPLPGPEDAAEARYRAVLDRVFDAIISVTPDLLVEDFNRAATELFGHDLDEVRGRPLFEVIIPPHLQERGRKVFRLLEKGVGPVVDEAQVQARDGSLVDVRICVDNLGEGQGYVAVLQDIRARKDAQDRLQACQERLRSLAEQLATAEERERRRIAGELHDQVGQALVAAKMKLQARLSDLDERHLEQAISLIEGALADTRSLTFELGSPVLYELGLRAAVEHLAEQHQEDHGTRVLVLGDGWPEDLAQRIQLVLFQAVRELLFNVARHAEASVVKIRLHDHHRRLLLEVKDDGGGFDPGRLVQTSESGGFGLFALRERLERLDGGLAVASSSRQGTSVTLHVPLERTTGPMEVLS